jgi:hypothetical protein
MEFELPFTLYQSLSLLFNSVTSLLLVYFGLHQHAITLRETRNADIRLESISFPNPEAVESKPDMALRNYGPGDKEHVRVDSVKLVHGERTLIEDDSLTGDYSSSDTWRAGSTRSFECSDEISEEVYEYAVKSISEARIIVTLSGGEDIGRSLNKEVSDKGRDIQVIRYRPQGRSSAGVRSLIESWIARNV